jgi:quercetin dioxygenase-like cupin family protein
MRRPSPQPSLHRCSLADLEAQITELAGQLNAATYRWLTLIGEFDRRQGWADGSLHSCAHWLNFKCGLDLGAAREKVRVASALPGVPKIAAAMQRGELSYSKVRALTRVATAATEENLLMIALHGTAHHVEKVVRLFRRAQEAEELSREAQQQAGRAVEYWYDTDGSLVLKARLPALAGGLLVKALEVALEAVPATELNVEFAEEQPVSYASRRADALARVAEGYLQNPVDSAESSTADRYQVVVHVDAETLKEQTAGRCHLEHGPALPAATVRRLTCDASLVVTGAIIKDVHDHVHVNLTPTSGENEDNEWNGEFSTEGSSNFAFADLNVVANGGHTGWHTHPGILLISVASGSIEWFDANCNRTVYNAGDSLTEANKPHYVRNVGSVDSRLLIAYVIPKDMPRRVDIPLGNIPACAHAAGIDN